jgi:hypothetical protein
MQRSLPDDFTFAVPLGTHYLWTERRTVDVSLAGTKVAQHDQSELRWDVVARPSEANATIFDQRLVSVKATHDGATVVDGEPAGAALQVVVDSGGNLQDVRGLQGASQSIQDLAPRGMEGRAARLFSPQDLRELVSTRHDLFLGDVVFRPAREGSTWIVPTRSKGDALFRRYTVEGFEPCDTTTCARLRLAFGFDPASMDGVARGIVERYLTAHEESARARDGAELSVREARYRMAGTALLDPSTLLGHGALMTESGRATVDGPDGKSYVVDLRGRTVDTYEYVTPLPAVAQR